ncbi:DUF2167 domain-containing protein [Mangrovimonas sp. ST2L15]|uniref:DUF2167 domain-containing protein n=1 Tax=Mangrovimonas sp. ST2L15 TaxID=1645916 RepID=UPI0006B5DC1F|nr:DUF2167 domain-containing protein [Mangrovimonas sp. ST2L15]
MKNQLFSLFIIFSIFSVSAQESADTLSFDLATYQKAMDSINNSFKYEHGDVTLGDDLAIIHIPNGYKFLNSEQTEYVLTELWNNPPSESLGMLLPENVSPLDDDFSYCIEISYSEDGYIDDEDAEDLDYDDLLEDMQKDVLEANPQRETMGYEKIELVGWAAPPYYDHENKKLHWAKELKFENYDVNTLNYEIRVLGRKGYLSLTAIGDVSVLDEFNQDKDYVIRSVEFNKGHRYEDFNPDIDQVAAYGIGGLIAGKILAKAGFFALLIKFWKFIAIGAIGLFSAFKKKIFRSSSNQEEDV